MSEEAKPQNPLKEWDKLIAVRLHKGKFDIVFKEQEGLIPWTAPEIMRALNSIKHQWRMRGRIETGKKLAKVAETQQKIAEHERKTKEQSKKK